MSTSQRAFLPGSDDREDEDTIEIQLSPAQYEVLVRAAEQAERDSAIRAVAIPAVELATAAAKEAASAAVKSPDAASDKEPAPAARRPTSSPVMETPPAAQPVENAVQVFTPTRSRSSGRGGSRLYLAAAGGAILLALCVTIAYQLGARARPAPPPAPAPVQVTAPVKDATPTPPAPPSPSPPAPPAIIEEANSAAPVRFKNPFDAGEVFEFPPGTSNAEARDAAAALLLKRAQERQTSLRHPKRDDASFARRT